MPTTNATFTITGWDEHQFDRHADTAKLHQPR